MFLFAGLPVNRSENIPTGMPKAERTNVREKLLSDVAPDRGMCYTFAGYRLRG